MPLQVTWSKHFNMLSSVMCSIPLLVLFATLPVSLPSVSAQNEVTCISNYAELKKSLFENGTGNMERLLYAFTPLNLPIPHYIWVYYYHNQSSEWSDILTCPLSQALQRCPIDNEDRNQDDGHSHVLFWSDSPMLINLDLPLLKTLSYNSILQYLGSASCVQLVIPPFCESFDQDSERDLIKYATSYLRSYRTSSEESERDYVLHCDDKLGTEFAYDSFLLGSELIICAGSGLLFVYLTFKLCTITYDRKRGEKSQEWCRKQDPSLSDVTQLKDTRSSAYSNLEIIWKNEKKFVVDFDYKFSKTYSSAVLIVDIITFSFLVTDAVQFSVNTEIIQEAFWYGYGSLNVILFLTAWVAILIQIVVIIINLVITIMFYIRHQPTKIVAIDPTQIEAIQPTQIGARKPSQRQVWLLCLSVVLSTVLTLIMFLYILSRAFFIALAIATYPFEVGFTLVAVGSGFIALLFVVWAAVHIGFDSYVHANRKLTKSTIFVLVPYAALLIILTGFLMSYIYVILRLNIRLADPVTSLVAALVPAAVAYVASNSYEKELKNIKSDETGEKTVLGKGGGSKHTEPGSSNVGESSV